MGKAVTRILAYVQICLVCGCIFYSTYAFFNGRFEQAFLPYPVLILYYLFFLRKTRSRQATCDSPDPSAKP